LIRRSTADIASFKHLRNTSWRLPPALRRKTGRPKKAKRIKGGMEASQASGKRPRKMTCGICGKKGHTKKTCPDKVV
jgi:hypothetical protein